MRRNTAMLAKDFQSSFLSVEKDSEIIIRKLFVESRPYSEILKKLLVINTKDCLDVKDSEVYAEILNKTSLKTLQEKGYIRFAPKLTLPEHEEVKSYILISFDDFIPNSTNPQFRDCTVIFDVLCHTDYWNLGNFRLRPIQIVGYIDGILNNTKLSGIGTFNFMGCTEYVLNENFSGYSLAYRAVHGSDDKIPGRQEDEQG